jgi:soluble lytic murein transglycosylase
VPAALAPLLVLLTLSAPVASTPGPETTPTCQAPFPAPPPAVPATPAPVVPEAPRIGEAQLAPAFAAGSPGAAGKAAYDAGRWEEAAAKLARAPEPEAAFLRALALRQLDRHGEAARALEGLDEQLPAIADRIRYLRGEALSGAGRKAEAAEAWATVPDGSLLGPEARLGRARLLAAQQDGEGALDALRPLVGVPAPADPNRPDPAATALLIAGRLHAVGKSPDLAAARQDYLACWVAHPLAPEAAECLTALRSLATPFGVPPGPEDAVQRAENLLEQNRNQTAIALLEPLAAAVRGAAQDAPLACRIRSALGRAERRERNYARAIAMLRPVVDGCKDPALRARALYVLAGATAIGGDRGEGIALFQRLEKEYPGHAFADDSLLSAAQLLARDGKVADARQVLAALIEGHPDGDQLWEARFLDAWLARSQGDVAGAAARLEAIEKSAGPDDAYSFTRATYWHGRILQAQGPAGQEKARALWTDIALRYPTDYYGLLARARLGEAGVAPPWPKPPPMAASASYDPGAFRDDPHLAAGLLLHRIGLPKSASEELQAVPLSRLKPGDPLDPVLLVADVLDRAGDPRAAHQLLRVRARDAFRRAPDADNYRAWLIAYPAAYRAEVEKWARVAGVPADLLQALMREESALDPRVISPAGALGLTQLMLPTAQQVAARLKLPRPSRGDLMQPALNIRIGARYLADLVRHQDGEVALALASYNAGAAAVARWRVAMPGLPLDEFVEQIPVDETRNYVKKVLRSYAAYVTLYGGGAGDGVPEVFRVAKE